MKDLSSSTLLFANIYYPIIKKKYEYICSEDEKILVKENIHLELGHISINRLQYEDFIGII